MELLNKIITKLGNDKVMHFLLGCWLVSMAIPYGIISTIIMFLFMIGISYFKEKKLDDAFDKNDIYAAIAGGILSVLLGLPSFIF